jgi:WD40 repeat protein
MNRPRWYTICILAGTLVPAAWAQPLPSYQELAAAVSIPATVRSAPSMLSRFPTTVSMALLADGPRGDSRQLLTIDINGRVWRRRLGLPDGPVLITETKSEPACAVLGSDGKVLAFADSDGSVSLLDLETGQTRFRDTETAERTVALALAPDSRSLAGVTVGGKVRIWSTATGQRIRTWDSPPGPVQTIAFSPNGEQLASAGFSHEIKLQRVRGSNDDPGEPVVIRLGNSRVSALAFSPDGQQLAVAASDGTVKVHDLGERREPVALGSHAFATWSLAFEPHGHRLAAGSWDGAIRLWDTSTWRLLQTVKTHEESVAAMLFDSKSGLLSAGLDGRLLHWLPDVPSIGPAGSIAGRDASVWVAIYSPDGKTLFVGGREKRFELWNLESKQLLTSREGHPTTRCAAFSPDGKTLATGGDDGKIFLCDAYTGKTRQALLRHRGAVSAVLFADEGHTLVSACDAGFVKLWDPLTGQEKASWKEHQQQIYCANTSPDGKWLITGGGNWTTGDPGELIVWDWKAGRVHAKVKGHKLAIWTIVFTQDGKHFACSDSSGDVKIWSLETLQEVRTLQHGTWVRPLALSPDGSTLAVGRGDGSIRLWDTGTWTEKAA